LTVLSIDTSASTPSLSLYRDRNFLKFDYPAEYTRNDDLSFLVKRVFEQVGISFTDIDHLVVGIGPGSFTGVRLGMSYVAGLSLCLDRPLYYFDSFRAAASYDLDYSGSVFCLRQIRRGEYLLAHYKLDNSSPRQLTYQGDSIVNQEELSEKFLKGPAETRLLIYDMATTLPLELTEAPGAKMVPFESVASEGLVRLLLEQIRETEEPCSAVFGEKIGKINPLYLTGVSAKTTKEREALI